jgi:hypothetical protein
MMQIILKHLLIKKNVNYVAPQIAAMYFDVQNCFASDVNISSNPEDGLDNLHNVPTDWD